MLRGIRMPSSAQPPSVDRADGGELRYRVAHRVKQWKSGEAPELLRVKTEGELPRTCVFYQLSKTEVVETGEAKNHAFTQK